MVTHRAALRLRVIVVWLCLLVLCSLTFAQGNATPIQIGQNAIGMLTATASTAQFALTASAGESVTVQVLALSPGFAASVTVTNAAGIDILSLPNTSAQTSISGSVTFDDAGIYTIEVSGANNTVGQFVISLQAGAPLPPPVDLTTNQPITDTVGSANRVRLYRFSTTSAAPSLLTVLSASPAAGALISLYDEDASKTIATNDAGISGIAYRLPPQDRHYHVEIHASGSAGDVSFTICLGDCGGGLLPAQASQTVAVTPTVAAAQATCTVAPGVSGSVNVRSGPSTIYAIVGTLSGGQTAPVLGQLSGGSWFEINLNGDNGWVAASVTKLDGDCTTLATVAPPVNAPLAPTQPPATNAPSSGGSAPTTPSSTSSSTGSMPKTTPTTVPTPAAQGNLIPSINSATYAAGTVTIELSILNRGTIPAVPETITLCVEGTCQSEPGMTPPIPAYATIGPAELTMPYTAPAFRRTISVSVALVGLDTAGNYKTNTATAAIQGH